MKHFSVTEMSACIHFPPFESRFRQDVDGNLGSKCDVMIDETMCTEGLVSSQWRIGQQAAIWSFDSYERCVCLLWGGWLHVFLLLPLRKESSQSPE